MQRITVLTALALTSACSTEVTFGTGSGGNGGSGAGTSTGTGTGGSIDVCAGFDDEESLETMAIRIYNGTSAPIYLPADCGSLAVDIFPLAGDDDRRYPRRGDPCFATCGDLQDGSPIVCGACQQTVVRVLPGETHLSEWDGQGYERRTMPDACWWDGQGGNCSQRVNAPTAAYELSVLAGTECIGFEGPNGNACECDDDVCYGYLEDQPLYANGVATLGADDAIELSFF